MVARITIILLYIAIAISSCSKTEQYDYSDISFEGKGVFLINEGNFTMGNGSLSFYSYDSCKLFNDIFSGVNNRPLGDVPNSMVIAGNKAFIVVNNSGKIEIIDKNSIRSQKTIDGLVSPRNILMVNNDKAYVSSLYSNSISVLNIKTNAITGYINIRRSSESMVLAGEKAYVSCWSSGKEIIVLDASTDKILDSVEVAYEPESMVVDKNNKLWVLCSGGYTRKNFAELIAINTITDKIDRRVIFPSKEDSPSCLQINASGDTLFFIKGGLWKMAIASPVLPVKPFIQASGRLFYKVGIDPGNDEIFLTNAMDYQQKGFMLRFRPNGELIDSSRAGIIPGAFCFK